MILYFVHNIFRPLSFGYKFRSILTLAAGSESNPNKKQSEDEEHIGSSSESGSCSEIVKERSSVSAVDLECGAPEIKLNLAEVERDCRICHLTLDTGHLESGLSIELGCSCKDDLAAAHKQCAEAWFKIKGNNKATQHSCWKIHFEDLRLSCSCCALHNMPCYSTHANYLQLRKTCLKTCEICGSIARNVAGANETELAEQWNEANDIVMATTTVPMQPAETRSFWQGHQFLNFLLACMRYFSSPGFDDGRQGNKHHGSEHCCGSHPSPINAGVLCTSSRYSAIPITSSQLSLHLVSVHLGLKAVPF
ncbi:hypothetical protein SADUNF_Sadunf08G0050300 [Salix dunnii]|uniref:RING-CH-type domain-containing protein n=1 Tax=Salix dunnii TaxID=1413687 RepID=A0A835JUV8_9ROSI|nr:hypothetical protein SADUNF_Sadunf08G0050300 [Salix dunnii]